jgi:hypothetical protein
MSKVVVTADADGNVIGVSKNSPEYGYVRVEQTVNQINDRGWLRVTKRSALIKGLVKDLIEAGLTAGKEIPGKIVVVESFQPFNTENPDRDLKIAGQTGVICRVDDEPIYRQTFYTSNLNAQDEFIMHNNTHEIREVQASLKAVEGLNANKPVVLNM